MQLDIRQASIPQLIGSVEQITREVEALIAPLSTAQLNWKPNAEEWSLGQCLDHVMVTNGTYFAPLEQLLAGQKTTTFWERVPVLPGLIGPMLIRSLQPESTQKAPTINAFAPTSSTFAPAILDAFRIQQARLAELMHACAGLDVERIIITSPAATFITYSLLNAFRIIVVHEQHHLAQTTKIMGLPGFPKA